MFGCGEGDVGEPAASQQGPDALDGVGAGGLGRQVVDGQPVARGGEVAQAGGFVDVGVVPDEDDRAAGFVVGGGQQVAVVAPGEALAAVAPAVVPAGPVDQPGPVAGPVAVSAAIETRLRDRPRTRTTGVRPHGDQVLACGGVMEKPASSSKTGQAPRAAADLPRTAAPP